MRRLGAGLAGLAVVLACLVYVPPSAAADDDAVQRFGACLKSEGEGRILLVIDTSASLGGANGTDPDAARVTAAEYLVRRLASYEDDVDLEIAVAGFADKFQVYREWSPLDSGSVSGISSAVEDFRDRDTGFETDYWTAVSGARGYLDNGAAKTGRACHALVWFSDGLYDLDKRDTSDERDDYGVTKPYGPDVELTSDSAVQSVERAGRTDLCREGGVADQLRAQGITTFAIGLSSQGVDDFSLMQGIATGSSVDGAACGRATTQSPGVFLLADQVRDLLFAIDQFDPDGPPIVQRKRLCQGSVCPPGTHQFVLDPSITRVHILAGSDVEGYRVELIAPTQSQGLSLSPGDPTAEKKTFPAFTATSSWPTDQDVEIDLVQKGVQGWVGRWQLVFIDPASTDTGIAQSNIHLYGDVKPAWLDAESASLTVGQTAKIRLGLVRADDGKPLDLGSLRSTVVVDATLEYPNGDSIPLASGLTKDDLDEPVEVDLTEAPAGPAIVHLNLNLTTAPAQIGGKTIPGTPLEPASVDYEVTIKPPPDFPIVPSVVSFGHTEEDGDFEAALPIQGDGCVWLDDYATLTLPEGVSAELASSADDDATCASGSLPLVLSVRGTGTGLASGELTVMTRSDRAGVSPVPVNVDFDLEMERPRNEGVFIPLLIALTLGGILIPILLLYLVKWWTARIPGTALSLGGARGQVDQGASFLGSTAITEQGMRAMTLVGTDRRSVQLNGASRLRTRFGLGLTEPGHTEVEGQYSASSANPATSRKGRFARLPLAVQDSWVALLDQTDPQGGPVEVLFIVSPISGRLPELLEDARARVPDVVTQLRSRLDGAPRGDGDGGHGGGGSAAPATNDWGGPGSAAPTPTPPVSDDWGAPPSSPRPTSGGSSSTFDEW